MHSISKEDWGITDYKDAWDKQERIFAHNLERKLQSAKEPTDYVPENRFIFCEHPHVYTIGRHGVEQNMLLSENQLNNIGATYYHIDRGGDITYHGPGQIVGYPLLDLEDLHLSIKEYVFCIEEMVIRTLLSYNIRSERLQGATGVWLDAKKNRARKICAIGIRASRHLTMHGFALNVNTDLEYFSYINPCGFKDKDVTSIAHELGKQIDMDAVKTELFQHFTEIVKNKT